MKKTLVLWALKWIEKAMKNSPDVRNLFVKKGNLLVDLPDSMGFDEERERIMLEWVWDRSVPTITKILKLYL